MLKVIAQNPSLLVSEAMLLRKACQCTMSLVFVEGPSDRELYAAFVAPREKACLLVCHGKRNVRRLVRSSHRKGISGIAGVVDTDCDFMEGNPKSADVFMTDAHDSEAMMIRSIALDKVLVKWADEEALEKMLEENGVKHLRELLVLAASPLGAIKALKSQGLFPEVAMKPSALNYGAFVEVETLKPKMRALCEWIAGQQTQIDVGGIEQAILRVLGWGYDPWLLCRGHDLVGMLVECLNGPLSSGRTARRRWIEEDLRLAYGALDFGRSELASNLRDWEARNSGFLILSDDVRLVAGSFG